MSWIYLIVAGLLEIGWPVGLKMSQEAETRVMGILLAIGFMAASGFCLWMAQKQIPIGTAYAVWTGIGAAGTFLVGVMFYGDPSSLARYFGVALCGRRSGAQTRALVRQNRVLVLTGVFSPFDRLIKIRSPTVVHCRALLYMLSFSG